MIVQRFRALGWVAGIASAATCLYLTSLQVAAERATLEDVETAIAGARRDIRQLQTELGTRASMRQLEKWNSEVLALSAPRADQYLHAESELASVGLREVQVPKGIAPLAPVMLAAAQSTPAPVTAPVMVASAPSTAKPEVQKVAFASATSAKPAAADRPVPKPVAKASRTVATTQRTAQAKLPVVKKPVAPAAKTPVREAAAKQKAAPIVRVAASDRPKPTRAMLTKGALGDLTRAAAAEGRRR